MGGSTKSTTATKSNTEPWKPAIPFLTESLGQLTSQLGNTGANANENQALNTLTNNALAGNPYANQITANATDLLNGGGALDQAGNIQSNFDAYKGWLTPYANGSMVGSNPYLKTQLDTLAGDITNSINGKFAAAGRDFSGANSMALARGLTQGMAPVLAAQYNTDADRQLNAANALYSGGNTTSGLLSGLKQQDVANRQAGVDASTGALQARDSSANQLLNIEQMRRSLPINNLGMLANIGIPIAGLGQQSNSVSQTTQTTPLGQQIMGGLLGGLGLVGQLGGFGGNGWLYGSGGSSGLLNKLFSK